MKFNAEMQWKIKKGKFTPQNRPTEARVTFLMDPKQFDRLPCTAVCIQSPCPVSEPKSVSGSPLCHANVTPDLYESAGESPESTRRPVRGQCQSIRSAGVSQCQSIRARSFGERKPLVGPNVAAAAQLGVFDG